MCFEPVVIIGAPRSGTNMLRDILTSFDDVATWPCDEINYIWRHGNKSYSSDLIPRNKVKPAIKDYIVQRFEDLSKKYNSKFVVEKTCANSLRVPFVDAILPNAKYIFIYRDGIDATGSAKERWTAKLDISYILQKVKYVPKLDLPYYAIRYLWSRVYRLISREKRLAFWGPSLPDMQEILRTHTLNEVCAIQWQRCVDNSEEAFRNMAVGKVVRICYEDFVRNPTSELKKIVNFLGIDVDSSQIEDAVKGVSSRSLGKGRSALGLEEVARLEFLIGDTLERYGYK